MTEPPPDATSPGGAGPSSHDPTPVTSWHAPRMYPDTYPGAAPAHHYLLFDGQVHPMTLPDGDLTAARLDDGPGQTADALLGSAGLSSLAERIPVLAYGANRNPHTLALKFDHYEYRTAGTSTAVPVLAGTLSDLDVVVAGLSAQGCLYADITPCAGTTVHVNVALLDVDQVRAIHESEGIGAERGGYDCARIPGFGLDNTQITLEPLGYAGTCPVFVSPATTQPIAFAAVPADGRRFVGMDQLGAMSHLIDTCDLTGALTPLLGVDPQSNPAQCARELIRVLSGAWWYVHNTGDDPPQLAAAIQRVLRDAIDRHRAPTSTSQHFASRQRLVDAATAFAAGPALGLGTQLG